jgi:hypothetical protein
MQALDQFAVTLNLGKDDYEIYVSINETWSSIHAIFVAKDFGKLDDSDRWLLVHNYLRNRFSGGDILGMNIHVNVRDFEQIKQTGTYSIPRSFTEIHDFLGIEHASPVS